MQAFVRLAGFGAAFFCWALAAVWAFGARPADERDRAPAIARCEAAVPWNAPDRLGLIRACRAAGGGWDDALLLQALATAGIGLHFALLAALVPPGVPRPRPSKPDVLDAIAMREEDARRQADSLRRGAGRIG
jgi:hypothetical protein